MCRAKLGLWIVVLLLLGIGLATAQEGANIVVAGEIVARVRGKGPYESIEHRAAAIDEVINDVIAAEDLENLEVSLKEMDGLWTVFVGDKRIMSVYPAEAEANQVTPQVLGSIWVKNLEAQLPTAKPVEVEEIAAPPAPAAEEPATEAVTNIVAVEVVEVPVSTTPPKLAAVQGAKLLIIDAFNTARQLDEDAYLTQRDGLAGNLLDNLVQVVSGEERSVEIVEPEVGMPETEAAHMAAPFASPAPTAEEVEVTTTEPVESAEVISEKELYQGVPEGDPNWAKVPQKRRIAKKFELAREPFYQLKKANPEAAPPVAELLSVARKEFTKQEFDACEQHLDYALTMLK